MTTQIKSIRIIAAFTLIASTLLFTSCTEQDVFYSYQGQIENNHDDVTWMVHELPHDFVQIQEDLTAGLKAELAKQQEEHPDAVITSVKVASVMIVSEDFSDFAYLDELELYLVAANPEDNVEQPAEAKGRLVGTLKNEQITQSHLNLQMTHIELMEELTNDQYDLYFVGKTNGKINQVAYDDNVDVKITFNVDISN